MSSGERPIGTAKGKQPNTEALCQPPPPPPQAISPPPPLLRTLPCSCCELVSGSEAWLCAWRLWTAPGYALCFGIDGGLGRSSLL